MQVAVALGVVVACVLVATGSGENATQPNRILFLAPISSKSHKNFYIGLAEGLADRGSQVCKQGRLTDTPRKIGLGGMIMINCRSSNKKVM